MYTHAAFFLLMKKKQLIWKKNIIPQYTKTSYFSRFSWKITTSLNLFYFIIFKFIQNIFYF